MNKQSNIMGFLSFVVLSGIVLSFLSMINVIIYIFMKNTDLLIFVILKADVTLC